MAFLRQCAPGLWFDSIYGECTEKELANCISGTISNPNKIPEAYSFVCPLHFNYDFLFFPHNSHCDQYYICEKGIAYLHDCPGGNFYDVYQEKCEDLSTAVCLMNL